MMASTMTTIPENQALNPICTQEVKTLKALNNSVKSLMKSIRMFFKTIITLNKIKEFLILLKKDVLQILKKYSGSSDVLTTHAFRLCKVREILWSNKKPYTRKKFRVNTDIIAIKEIRMLI